jgi:tRNA (guanine-N1)-methyltransferase
LLSGNHAAIARWRKEQAIEKTRRIRPDLLEKSQAEEPRHSPEPRRSSPGVTH